MIGRVNALDHFSSRHSCALSLYPQSMEPTRQTEALGILPLTMGERADIFLARPFDKLECLSATFSKHAYAPHAHDTFVVGTIESGCETWRARGRRHYGRPGDLCFINPLDVHDGEAADGGYSYRMTYPTVGLLREIAAALVGREAVGTPFFAEPAVHDPEGAALFSLAHRTMQDGGDGFGGEELLLRAYAHCLARHARLPVGEIGRETGPIARARDLLEQRYEEDLSLADVAELTGLARHRLIRAFRAETGMTPHAYLVDVRVRRAREQLRRGDKPGAVAAATGFCDQAHLTRAFKARYGVTPGAFRGAHLS
ncbi:AraC family transcriptional regulator [Bosea lathyri]|nr:AraC family transcriptional regulator [Bosea lathyri]